MKRLYARVRTVDVSGGFTIALDDKPIRTPGRWPLLLPTRDLAEAIAEEWRGQGAKVRPDTMPLMQLAATAIDHVVIKRTEVETVVLRYAETDTVCYRADQPAELARLQEAAWDPLLDWLEEEHGVRLAVQTGVLPVAQSPEALAGLAEALTEMDAWRLTAFQAAAASSGSFVIALALVDRRIDAEEAFRVAEIDSSFQIERWGEDAEASHRRATLAADLAAARRFHDLLGH
jgi:chaperone required for assembly of F1-ATPase